MSEKKNIDKFFQEQFRDFEADVPESAWPEIERRLQKKKKRRVVPIWWRLGGVAALLLIGLLVIDPMGWRDAKRDLPSEAPIVQRDTTQPVGSGSQDQHAVADADSTQLESDEAIANGGVHSPASGSSNVEKNDASNGGTSDRTKQDWKDIDRTKTNDASAVATAERKNNSANGADGSTKPNLRNANRPGARTKQNPNAVGQTDDAIAQSANNNRRTAGERNRKKSVENVSNVGTTDKSPNEERVAQANPSDRTKKKLDATQSATEKQNVDTGQTESIGTNLLPKTDDKTAVATQEKKDLTKDSTAVAEQPNPLDELLQQKGAPKDPKSKSLKRWEIASTVAPIYAGSTAGGSPIDTTFAGNSKSYDTQLSYGLAVEYALSKKFKLRAGVNKVSMSYNTNDVALYATMDGNTLPNLDSPAPNNSLGFGKTAARGVTTSRSAAVTETGNLETDKFQGRINQKMGYIEVPLELSYAVLDHKFGIDVIAGVSTLFLDDNRVMLYADGFRTDLGKANNLNATHFSSNLGVGFRYAFWNSFEANFQPTFKYQINTFSGNDGNFKPFFFGLYSGLSFRF